MRPTRSGVLVNGGTPALYTPASGQTSVDVMAYADCNLYNHHQDPASLRNVSSLFLIFDESMHVVKV